MTTNTDFKEKVTRYTVELEKRLDVETMSLFDGSFTGDMDLLWKTMHRIDARRNVLNELRELLNEEDENT